MSEAAFVPVLGHPRVIAAGADAGQRVLAHDGDRIIGVAAFEAVGPVAEAIITLAPDASGGLVPYLLDELTEKAVRRGLFELRFDFAVDDQRGIAERIADRRGDCQVRRDHLDVRLGAQVAHRDRVQLLAAAREGGTVVVACSAAR